MRPRDDHYEFVCVYVDDLMVIMKEPQQFFDELSSKYKYKLKGVGPPKYHLGGISTETRMVHLHGELRAISDAC